MKSHKLIALTAIFLSLVFAYSCTSEKDQLVTIHTRYGDMKVLLYDETPKHKENFLKLAKEGLLDSTDFHRVIQNFMIQGGDVNAKKNSKEQVNYTIEAEIVDTFIHEKGALAAARLGDMQNPTKASSGSQFYIVHGQVFSENDLRDMAEGQHMVNLQQRFGSLLNDPEYSVLREEVIALQDAGDMEGIMQKITESEALLIEKFGPLKKMDVSEQRIRAYSSIGGSPHLDGEYTIFGKVVEGLAVIDSIATLPTGAGDRPLDPVYMTISIEKVSKNKIEQEYGYQYPDKNEVAE